jgi:hypothetical protein
MKQKASQILMIRPVRFGYNEETAGSNSFQNKQDKNTEEIQAAALKEFEDFVAKIKSENIDVVVFDDNHDPHTPDSIFPNNWISFHENAIVLYPMLAENRRKERRKDIISHFTHSASDLIDLSGKEEQLIFLEGTGSIVFDYDNHLAYANISPRTNPELLQELCTMLNYKAVLFKAVDTAGADIYHTNVLMCIGNTFAVICTECIKDAVEREKVIDSLEKTGHEVIDISYSQMNSFAGNMYQLFNKNRESYIAMSEQAYKSLSGEQVKKLEKHGKPLYSPLYTIEKYGGGSARCMMADVRVS